MTVPHMGDSIAVLGALLSFAPPALRGAWLERHDDALTTCWVAGVMLMALGVLGRVF